MSQILHLPLTLSTAKHCLPQEGFSDFFEMFCQLLRLSTNHMINMTINWAMLTTHYMVVSETMDSSFTNRVVL